MNVGGVETAAVYLSPQAITPLSASKEPIALALAVRPDLTESTGTNAAKAAEKVKPVGAADKAGLNASPEKRTPILSAQSTTGAAAVGRVDVYV